MLLVLGSGPPVSKYKTRILAYMRSISNLTWSGRQMCLLTISLMEFCHIALRSNILYDPSLGPVSVSFSNYTLHDFDYGILFIFIFDFNS